MLSQLPLFRQRLPAFKVGGEKATRGDFVPAVARKMRGEEGARDALRAVRDGRDGGAAAGDTETEEEEEEEVLGRGRLAREERGALDVAWALRFIGRGEQRRRGLHGVGLRR